MGLLINYLRLWGILPGNIFTVYAFNVGVLLEFSTLSISLSHQFKNEIQARLKAQNKQLKYQNLAIQSQHEKLSAEAEKNKLAQKINEELEQKVVERTTALAQKNDQLNDLIKKLSSLNLQYDKENWEIKQTNTHEKRQLLLNESLTYKEFKKIYPTQFICLQFLANKKWQQTFNCKNCGYDKYAENTKNLERKCSRCGKIHSVTESTLFHAQKTALPILFYLTYLYHKDGKINVQLTSEQFNISPNTIYNFLKKLKQKQKQHTKNWLDWIIHTT